MVKILKQFVGFCVKKITLSKMCLKKLYLPFNFRFDKTVLTLLSVCCNKRLLEFRSFKESLSTPFGLNFWFPEKLPRH